MDFWRISRRQVKPMIVVQSCIVTPDRKDGVGDFRLTDAVQLYAGTEDVECRVRSPSGLCTTHLHGPPLECHAVAYEAEQ